MSLDLRELNKSIKELNQNTLLLLSAMQKEEPIPEEEVARDVFKIGLKTLRNYVSEGKLDGTFTIDVLGHRWYYKSKLIKPLV